MKNEKIELKSLKILNAVLETKSVTAAAEMLDTSPSSVTYAINKLRDITTNPIFTRGKNGVVATTLALDLNSRYVKAMSLINDGLDVGSPNSLSDFNKEIIFSTYTFVEFWLSSLLLKNRSLKDDRIALKFTSHPLSKEERVNRLRNREVDIDIGSELPRDNSIMIFKLFSTGTRAMVSNTHTSIKTALTVEDWHNHEHVAWIREDYGMTSILGDAITLSEVRDHRNVLITTASSLNMMMLCAHSDNIMLVPTIFTSFLKKVLPVNIFDIPFDVNINTDFYLHCHNQSLNDVQVSKILNDINKLVAGQ